MFNITIRATSILVQPGAMALPLLTPLLSMFHYDDEFHLSEEGDMVDRCLGYYHNEESDIIYFNKGINLEYLQKLLKQSTIKRDDYWDYRKMKFQWEEIIPPRNDEQIDVIDFISGMRKHSQNIDKRQIFLRKQPGFGKSYCGGAGAGKLGIKTLIIMHRDQLRTQWKDSLSDMNGFGPNEVHLIEDGHEIERICNGKANLQFDIYLMTHATFQAGLRKVGFHKIPKLTKNLGIGFKIIDEVHLHLRNTLLIDYCFNVYRNLYLTATAGRSHREEDAIFKHVFTNCEYYKRSDASIPRKWVEYNVIQINTNVPQGVYRYKVCFGGRMTPASYGKSVILRDQKKTHFKVARDLLKSIYEKDQKAKVLIFVPLIEICKELDYFLSKELNYDSSFEYNLDIRTINSKNSKSDNERNKRGDVIITTIGSCGTGTDIPGVTDIISMSPYVSKITAEQVHGRIRYCGKLCHYYDIYDSSVFMDKVWCESRARKLGALSTETKFLTWEE